MPARRRAEAEDLSDGTITALVPLRGKAERVRVYLDGRAGPDLAATVVDQAGLRTGDLLCAERQRELRLLDTPYRAREQAVRLLAVRDRSEREIERRLRQAGFESQVATGTMAWLRDLGYVDDRRFASRYAAEKQRAGWGSRRISVELAGKGVERPVIEEALSALATDAAGADQGQDELERTVRRRFSAQFAADPDAAERRLAGFLARRGYDWDTIGRMGEMLRAEASADGSPSSVP